MVQLKAYESTVHGKCSDVPLKLENLFGVDEPAAGWKQTTQANQGAVAATAAEEEHKSETKALGDA